MLDTILPMPAQTAGQSKQPLLEYFYSRHGLPVPNWAPLRREALPEPARTLLVHSLDMTPTLENFYGHPLSLSVLSRRRLGELYFREVVLSLAGDRRPVEYGVICIHLDHLPEPSRRLVLAEVKPLGDILRTELIPHLSWPQAFFRINADAHMGTLLGVSELQELYGRRNVLVDGSRRLLADVVEVLAPAAATDESPRKTTHTL